MLIVINKYEQKDNKKIAITRLKRFVNVQVQSQIQGIF
jgi:hypothetical protein